MGIGFVRSGIITFMVEFDAECYVNMPIEEKTS